VQNSIEAQSHDVKLSIVEKDAIISVEISDNGKGMDEKTKCRVFDPFFTEPGKHDSRKVGLGLPILKQMCEECGGSLTLNSVAGKGTTLKYSFDATNIDLPPWGDISKCVVMLMNYPGEFELEFLHTVGEKSYSIKKSELCDAVGGLESVEGLSLAIEFLKAQEESLR
jgi:hypothetical protein